MNLKKIFSINTYLPNQKTYNEMIEYDYKFNATFRSCDVLPKSFLNSNEWKFIKYYRKFQCNKGNLWGKIYKKKLQSLSLKTGIDVENNTSIGKGLIVGHWGRIIINGSAHFGNEIFITHGVTIGRDTRGKRKGVPTFGDRVCIRVNSTVVGNVHIGNDVLIAPNTFVNFDVPDHSIVIGNPATVHYRDNATEGHIPEIN